MKSKFLDLTHPFVPHLFSLRNAQLHTLHKIAGWLKLSGSCEWEHGAAKFHTIEPQFHTDVLENLKKKYIFQLLFQEWASYHNTRHHCWHVHKYLTTLSIFRLPLTTYWDGGFSTLLRREQGALCYFYSNFGVKIDCFVTLAFEITYKSKQILWFQFVDSARIRC